LFASTETISTKDVATALGLSDRMARELVRKWVEQGLLISVGFPGKGRRYALSEIYRQLIGNIPAI